MNIWLVAIYIHQKPLCNNRAAYHHHHEPSRGEEDNCQILTAMLKSHAFTTGDEESCWQQMFCYVFKTLYSYPTAKASAGNFEKEMSMAAERRNVILKFNSPKGVY